MGRDRWQSGRQLVANLKAKAWSDSPAGAVLVDAFLTDEASDQRASQARPFALVRPLGADVNEEHPDLEDVARFEVSIVSEAYNDSTTTGKSSLVGDGTQSRGASTGRGSLELEELVRQALTCMDGSAGIQSKPGPRQPPEIQNLNGSVTLAILKVEVEVYNGTRDRYYPEASKFKATGGSGSASLTWALPPATFDRVGVVLRRSAAGGSAPATVTDGTAVTLSGYTATSVTPSLAAGTYAFSLFGAFDELSATPTTPGRYSDPVTFTGVVVT